MEVIQKMQLFETHQVESRSDWHKLMEDVLDNFESMYLTGLEPLDKVDLRYESGFERLDSVTCVFMRCMLKWCVEEDGSVNREFVDILTDVETHMADAVRFILQNVESGAASFDGKVFSNMDHLLPRMAKACLHVLTVDSSPPNFDISHRALERYGGFLCHGSWECQGSVLRNKIQGQVTMVRSLTEFVEGLSDEINHGNGQELLISLESLHDKVACHVFLGCWETYYNMYLSVPNIDTDMLFLARIRKVTALHLDLCPVSTWTDKILEAYVGYAQKNLTRLQEDEDADLTRPVKDQLEKLRRELGIIIKVRTSFPSQLQGSNLVDVQVEVQALVGCIESLIFSTFTTQAEDINIVVASAAENISLGLQSLLSSIIKDRVMQLTSCVPVPLTREFLIELMGRVLRFMSQMLEDNNIIWMNPMNDQLEMLPLDLETFVNFHMDYPQGYYAEHEEGVEAMDLTVEVQTMAKNIESFIYSFFTQTEDIELVVCAAVENINRGLWNFPHLFLEAWMLQLTSLTTRPLTDKLLIQLMEYVQQLKSRMLKDEKIVHTSSIKDQVECLYRELGILVNYHISYPLELYTDEGPNLVDVRTEVQVVARNLAYFMYSTFIIQIKESNVDAAAQAKISLGHQNLLASVLKAWVLQLTSCTTLPLTNEVLLQFMECVQRFLSVMSKHASCPLRIQLEFLLNEMYNLVHFHINYPPQLYAEECSNLVVRLEVQTVAHNIASFLIQAEGDNDLVAATTKSRLGVRSLVTSVLKTMVLQLSGHTTLLTNEVLLQFMECVQRFLSAMSKDSSGPLRIQLEFLQNEMGNLVHFHINYPPQLYSQECPNLVAVRLEVQTVAQHVASFIIQTDGNNDLVAATAKSKRGVRSLLVSVIKTWILQLTSCTILQLTNEVLLQFMECVQRFLSLMSKDVSGSLRIQLEFLHNEMGNLVHFHVSYLPVAASMEVQTMVMNTASFVCSTLISQAKEEEEDKVILGVHNLLTSILTSWVFTINAKEYLESMMSFPLSDVVEKFAKLKVNVEDTMFLITVFRLRRITPLTDQLGFLEFFLENVKESVNGGPDLGEFQTVHEALLLLRVFLGSMPDYSITYSHDVCERVANVAYEAECLMYSLDDGSYSASCRNRWIYHFAQHVELTKPSALDTLEKKENDGEMSTGSTGDQDQVLSKALIPTIDLVVGFENELQHVKLQLVASHRVKQLDVISIIGMPGLGKTTLARKVYEDRQVAGHFQIRAWCIVSNEWNKKELLLTILGCIIELTDMIQKMSEVNLSTLLHKQLMGRRYLVVLDDVWGIDAFEFLKVFLPDNKNGSRILLTSRNKAIGLKTKHHSDILELRLLTNDESWVLLSKKVYLNDECPLELCQVGKRIAESCRGLPLAVVVVAGLLAKSCKTREFWEQVVVNLGSYISHDSQAQGMAVLELSYKYLPRHLKPLFLYTGAFPEDREVSAEKLIWLWLAEGFVKDNLIGSLEHQAELYLLDLIDRSFLMVAARRSDGRVKTCIVHDLLRDMSIRQAKEENLLQQINVSDDLPDPVSYQRRLSILLQRRKEVTPTHLISDGASTRCFIVYEDLSTLSLLPPLYSLLFFNKNRSLPLWKEAVASVLLDLKLLRILHFESTSIDADLCGDVMMLVHLRYISIRAVWNLIPSTISKLRNLETLIIKGLRGEIEVSKEIWELVKLRHLHVNDRAKFSDPSDKSSMLENLETLSTPAVCRGEEVKLMKRLPNVRKLRCVFLESCPSLESSNQLESLKAIYTGVGRCPGSFVVSSTLKKLSLSKFRLKWEQVSALQKLPELEILNLRIGAVDGESWTMDDEEGFLKLKVLKLESLNIKRWTAFEYNFPCLEKLVLKKCKQLMEIPSELGGINSLQKMEVLSCSNAAAISAKRIEEEQKDAGNEWLEFHIYSPSNLI